MFRNWNVIEDASHNRKYLYGPLSDYSEEELEGWAVVHECNYMAKDIATMFDGELEGHNFHSIADLGTDLLKTLDADMFITPSQKTTFMRIFVKNFMEKQGWE